MHEQYGTYDYIITINFQGSSNSITCNAFEQGILALTIMLQLKGEHLEKSDCKRWVIVVLVSIEVCLQALESAFTYLDDKYLIGRVQ